MIKYSLYLFILFSFFSCTKKEAKQDSRPNIVCLVAEDISPYVGCYGDSLALTPNIDMLAKNGMRFTQMHSVAGVCAPSRNALITGMYPTSIGGNNMRTTHKDGIANQPNSLQVLPYECTPPAEVKCYTEFFRNAGYYCINNEKEDYQFKSPKSAWDESSRYAHWRNRPDGKPFLAVFNFMRSHESQVWVWQGEPLVVSPDSVTIPPYLADTKATRMDFAQMYTNNTIMDRMAGEIIAQLEEDGLLDNTFIIFYSDHGGPMPRGKREVLQSGTRVPFVVRFPKNMNAGQVTDELCSFVDIPPTLLSLAGIQIPDYMQGQAFLGKQKAKARKYIYAARDRMDEWFDVRRAVGDKKYRYVKNIHPEIGAYLDLKFRKKMNTMTELLKLKDEGKLSKEQMYWFRETKSNEELYDLENDPYELNNLAEHPSYDSVLTRFRTACDAWLHEIDDKGIKYKSEKDLVESMWPNNVQPETKKPDITIHNGEVTLASNTEGASIVYQINHQGYNSKHWFLYSHPFGINKGDTITALAHRIGYKESLTSIAINNEAK